MNVADHLRGTAARFADRRALVHGTRCWNWSELNEQTDRIAAGLRHAGIQPGDRVALHLSNCAELVLAYYGVFKAGAVSVPVNNRFAPDELKYSLGHSACRVLIGQPDLYGGVAVVRSELPDLRQCYLIGADRGEASVLPFSSLCDHSGASGAGDLPALATDDNQPAAILYTSGTTSRPKGVTHTHRTLTATARHHNQHIALTSDDVVCVIPPMCHILGFATQLVSSVFAGAQVILPMDLNAATILSTIQEHHATRMAGLPVMYQSLVNHPDAKHDRLDSMRTCIAGGDSVPVALQEQFQNVFGRTILEGCGMTEVIPFALNIPGQHRRGSIGRACPGVSIRLADEAGNTVRTGEIGELLVSGETVMTGYWREPELTAQTLAGGEMQTGDLARQDEDGYFWFVGRKKEIIIRGGSNISPLEVEDVLYQHPAVLECGVVGVPDAALGEVVWAWVAIRSGQSATSDDLRTFLNGKIAAYKIPENILFLDVLPKGLTGKINRRALRDRAVAMVKTPARS